MLQLRLVSEPSALGCTQSALVELARDGAARRRLCWTLEVLVREPREGQPAYAAFDTRQEWFAAMTAWVASWKIDKQTAIPSGTYDVIMTMSTRFKRVMPLVVDVPGYSGIRFHPGNTDVDTEGCIIPGWEKEPGKVWQSKLACDELYALDPAKPGIITTALLSGERVTLEIVRAWKD